MLPDNSPEPSAVVAVSSAVAVHVASRRWLSFFRSVLKMKIILILMILIPCSGSAVEKTEDDLLNPFAKIELKENTIVARLPDSGIRWLLKRGTQKEVTNYGQVIYLKNSDEIILVDKHTTYTIRAEIRGGRGFVHFTCMNDARSFGEGTTSTSGTIEVK